MLRCNPIYWLWKRGDAAKLRRWMVNSDRVSYKAGPFKVGDVMAEKVTIKKGDESVTGRVKKWVGDRFMCEKYLKGYGWHATTHSNYLDAICNS